MIKSRELGQIRIPKGYYLDRDSVRRGISGYDGHETFCYTLVMLVVDILYGFIDPQIKARYLKR